MRQIDPGLESGLTRLVELTWISFFSYKHNPELIGILINTELSINRHFNLAQSASCNQTLIDIH